MTFRNDVTVDWRQSPRLIFVAAPSTEITIQDLHDTLRVLEERPWEGLPYPSIVETAGKEELGGGVTVGLTMKLLNAKLAFQGRKTSTETGTITTADTTGYLLTDSNATFVTNGVQPGASIVNLTDGSRATVLRVVSQTVLETDILGDGVDNQFGLGDSYEVQNVTQVTVDGGNLVAVDADLVTPMDPILPTVGTQVVRTSSSSATLQELLDIQYNSFNGAVTVDILSSYSGTEYPIGTPRKPVNNLVDALSIAATRGFTTFLIIGHVTIDSGLDYTGIIFKGESPTRSHFVLDSGAIVSGCEFYDATISGTLDGGAKIDHCNIENLNYVDGFIEHCVLSGTITLGGNAHFLDCWSGVPGVTTPIIDFNGSAAALALRNYNGGITLRNKTGAQSASIDLNSGQIILESTVTNGTIVCRGVGKLINNSVGATIVNEVLGSTTIASAVWSSVVDGTITAEQSVRLMNAILGGKVNGAGTGTETFRNPDDNKNRVVSTVDSEGNRTTVVRDLS